MIAWEVDKSVHWIGLLVDAEAGPSREHCRAFTGKQAYDGVHTVCAAPSGPDLVSCKPEPGCCGNIQEDNKMCWHSECQVHIRGVQRDWRLPAWFTERYIVGRK